MTVRGVVRRCVGRAVEIAVRCDEEKPDVWIIRMVGGALFEDCGGLAEAVSRKL